MKKWNVFIRLGFNWFPVKNSGRDEIGRLFSKLDDNSPIVEIEARTKSEAKAVFKRLAGLRPKEQLRSGLKFQEVS